MINNFVALGSIYGKIIVKAAYVFYPMDSLNRLCAPKDGLETCGLAIQALQV